MEKFSLRADFFNVLNPPSRDNPASNLSLAGVDADGAILNPGNFGRILGFDSSPRIIQISLKLSF